VLQYVGTVHHIVGNTGLELLHRVGEQRESEILGSELPVMLTRFNACHTVPGLLCEMQKPSTTSAYIQQIASRHKTLDQAQPLLRVIRAIRGSDH
jgi:hypothetical protein